MFLLLSYSFGIETINKFIHPRSSLENNTRFQAKMGRVRNRLVANKVHTLFRAKTEPKPTLLGGPYLYGLYRECPPGEGGGELATYFNNKQRTILQFCHLLCRK